MNTTHDQRNIKEHRSNIRDLHPQVPFQQQTSQPSIQHSSLLKTIPENDLHHTLSISDNDDEKEIFKSSHSHQQSIISQSQLLFSANKEQNEKYISPVSSTLISNNKSQQEGIHIAPSLSSSLNRLPIDSSIRSLPPSHMPHIRQLSQYPPNTSRPQLHQNKHDQQIVEISPFQKGVSHLKIPLTTSQIGTPRSQSSILSTASTPLVNMSDSTQFNFSQQTVTPSTPTSVTTTIPTTTNASIITTQITKPQPYIVSLLSHSPHDPLCNATMSSRLNAMQLALLHSYIMSGKVVNYLQPPPIIIPINKALSTRPVHKRQRLKSDNYTLSQNGQLHANNRETITHSNDQARLGVTASDIAKVPPFSFLTATSLATIPENRTLFQPNNITELNFNDPISRSSDWYLRFLTNPQLRLSINPKRKDKEEE